MEGRLHQPNMLRMFWIEITFVIFAVDRLRDHMHVALMFTLAFGFLNCAIAAVT